MIVSKVVSGFLVWFVFVNTTSAFVGDVPNDVFRLTKTAYSVLQKNPELANKVPSLVNAFSKVSRQGIAFIKANPALGVTIYLGAILVTADYLSKDATKHLMEARFQYEDLDMVIEFEVLPGLELIDKAIEIAVVDSNKIKGFCRAPHEMFEMTINYLRKERKKIEKRMIESTTGETRSKMLKYLSTGIGVVSTVGTAATCLGTGPACPIIAGSGMTISSGIGYYLFGESQSTYRESIEVLVIAREKALYAEKKLQQARADIDKVCFDLMTQNYIGFLD